MKCGTQMSWPACAAIGTGAILLVMELPHHMCAVHGAGPPEGQILGQIYAAKPNPFLRPGVNLGEFDEFMNRRELENAAPIDGREVHLLKRMVRIAQATLGGDNPLWYGRLVSFGRRGTSINKARLCVEMSRAPAHLIPVSWGTGPWTPDGSDIPVWTHNGTPIDPGRDVELVTPPTAAAGNRAAFACLHSEKLNFALIAVKGTSELPDFLTDANAVPVPAPEIRVPEIDQIDDGNLSQIREPVAHEGMLKAARAIVNSRCGHEMVRYAKEGKDVRVVGSSLGAGVASLVAMMLRKKLYDDASGGGVEHPWKKVEAFTFASVPSVDLRTAHASRSFIRSLVLMRDPIPRLSVQLLARLASLRRNNASRIGRWLTTWPSAFIWRCFTGDNQSNWIDREAEHLFVAGTIYHVADYKAGGDSRSFEPEDFKDSFLEVLRPDHPKMQVVQVDVKSWTFWRGIWSFLSAMAGGEHRLSCRYDQAADAMAEKFPLPAGTGAEMPALQGSP